MKFELIPRRYLRPMALVLITSFLIGLSFGPVQYRVQNGAWPHGTLEHPPIRWGWFILDKYRSDTRSRLRAGPVLFREVRPQAIGEA